jgi:hypothetical protein
LARQGEIDFIRERFGLSQDDLTDHFKAYYSLSNYGNSRALDAIPDEKRDRIAQFYKSLRQINIFCYNPESGKSKETIGYYQSWVKTLRNNPDRPEFKDINIEQVKEIIKNGMDEFKKNSGFRERGKTQANQMKSLKEVMKKSGMKEIPF